MTDAYVTFTRQFERNTSTSSPLGPAANTLQADEENFGLTRTSELGIN